MITKNDKLHLRELAKNQLEIANSKKMNEIVSAWKSHRDFEPIRPIITIEMLTFKDDIIPDLLKCESAEGRCFEEMLLYNIINHTMFNDDAIVNDYIGIGLSTYFVPFGIEVKKEDAEEGSIGHHFATQINDLQNDFHLLKKSTFGYSLENTKKTIDQVNDLIGDILPAKLVGSSKNACITGDMVRIMNMENFLFSMYDYPELVKEMAMMIATDYIEFYEMLNENKLILPTNGSEHLCQGSLCYTNELPNEVKSLKDIWGYTDSQETVGVDPKMFFELLFPAYKKYSDNFGLLSYGCCEPVHTIWDNCLSKLENMRMVSISPWCDEEFMADRLSGKKIIYERKPTANFIGVDKILDENAVRKYMSKTIRLNKGRPLEFSCRDVYTIHKNPQKVKRYIELIREECEKNW